MTDLEEWEEYNKLTTTFLLKSNCTISITEILEQAFGTVPVTYVIDIKSTFYPMDISHGWDTHVYEYIYTNNAKFACYRCLCDDGAWSRELKYHDDIYQTLNKDRIVITTGDSPTLVTVTRFE